MSNKTRDEKGRFITDIKEDAESVYSICLVIYKMIPLILIAILAFKYFDVSKLVEEIFLVVGCGSSKCKCVCNNGIDYNNKNDF